MPDKTEIIFEELEKVLASSGLHRRSAEKVMTMTRRNVERRLAEPAPEEAPRTTKKATRKFGR